VKKLPKETWSSIRSLFVSGVSLRQIAKQTGVSIGTLCSRAKREKWSRARHDTETLKEQVVPFDPVVELANVTVENSRATRLYMSQWLLKCARQLAETGDFPMPKNIEEVKALEAIRASLFPVPAMSMIDQRLQIEGKSRLILHYGHEIPPEKRTKDMLILKWPGKGEDGEQPADTPAE
jgi:hypothetical protein